MELELTKPKKSFNVEVSGVNLGRFEVESEWEDFIKLVNLPTRSSIIAVKVCDDSDAGIVWLNKMCGSKSLPEGFNYTIIQYSTDIQERVKKALIPNSEGKADV